MEITQEYNKYLPPAVPRGGAKARKPEKEALGEFRRLLGQGVTRTRAMFLAGRAYGVSRATLGKWLEMEETERRLRP